MHVDYSDNSSYANRAYITPIMNGYEYNLITETMASYSSDLTFTTLDNDNYDFDSFLFFK